MTEAQEQIEKSLVERGKEVVERLITLMGLSAETEMVEEEDRILITILGPDTGLIIGKKGQTLDALQHLTNKILSSGKADGLPKPIHLDSEGYRSRRNESLVELAHRLAEKAVRTGRPVAADPMSAADRRVIHMTLAESAGVTTRSEGEGIHRHLVVVPTEAGADVDAEAQK